MTLVFHSRLARLVTTTVMLALLAACVTQPVQESPPAGPKTSLQFVDLERFDQELAGSLGAPLPAVDVSFYTPVTPNALPERLQKWMAAVEEGGGTVKITQPKSTVTAKNPFMLISVISSLWTANKLIKESATAARFKTALTYDADILLKVDERGETVVDKVLFTQRKK